MTFYVFKKRKNKTPRIMIVTYYINSIPIFSELPMVAVKEKFSLKHNLTRLQYIEVDRWNRKIFLEVNKTFAHD